jgi:hypothetical protein
LPLPLYLPLRAVVQAKSPGKNLVWVYALPTATDGATITVTISPK